MTKKIITIALALFAIVGVALWLFGGHLIKTEPNWDAVRSASQPKKISLDKLVPGVPFFVKWRAKPYTVMKLSAENLRDLGTLDSRVCKPTKAEKVDIVVLSRVNTTIGCVITHVPKVGQVNGGYIDQCKGYKYDYLGRFLKESESPEQSDTCAADNLPSPKYRVENGSLVIYGASVPSNTAKIENKS